MTWMDWIVYAAAEGLYRSDNDTWLDLPFKVRRACRHVVLYYFRTITPYPDLTALIKSLTSPTK